jgi:hypothetical protein
MKYTEDNPPICKCGCKMRLYQEPVIVPVFYWACAKRGIFNFWRHTASFGSEYGYQWPLDDEGPGTEGGPYARHPKYPPGNGGLA